MWVGASRISLSEKQDMGMNYTLVLGVDKKTLEFLKIVLPTWAKHKPSLFWQPWIIFYNGVEEAQIKAVLDVVGVKQAADPRFIAWPKKGVTYERDHLDKWTNPQRAKMLAGFAYVAADHCLTPYWLKLDLDAVATGRDDWVDPGWFDGNPSIIAPGWPYTKPADQMQKLDAWVVQANPGLFLGTEPLNLKPSQGSDKVIHERICSWCAFFSTEFTRVCVRAARYHCGEGQLPVDSQDGFMWYCAKRAHFTIRSVRMKRFGWTYRSTYAGVMEAAQEAMQCATSNVPK
jgi:hypothetical protein